MIFEIILKIWRSKSGKSNKMIISRAPERFQKGEFDTMLPSMSPKAPIPPQGLKNDLNSEFQEVRGESYKGDNPINRAPH